MPRRLVTTTAVTLALAASAFVAAPASAQNVGFGLSISAPGLTFAIGTPAFGAPAFGGAAFVAPRPAFAYGPYRAHHRPWVRPYAPVIYRPPVVAYPAPVVVPRVYAPRPAVYAAPYAHPAAVPYGVY